MRRSTIVAVMLALLGVALAVAGIAMSVASGASTDPVSDVLYGLNPVVAAIVAVPIIIRRPRNPIGWLMLAIGLNIAVESAASAYSAAAFAANRAGGLGVAAAWLGQWAWAPPSGELALLLLLFPDGHLPSPRWKIVAYAAVLAPLVVSVLVALQPGPIAGLTNAVDNPLGLEAMRPLGILWTALFPLVPATVLAAAGSLVVRFRRADGVERLQLKWLTFASAIGAVFFVTNDLGLLAPLGAVGQDVGQAGLYGIPVAIGIAVLRHRLYDIDVIINRALVYGVTTAGIAFAFFAGIVVLQALLRPVTSGSELAVAASTLISFALFQPFRRRVRETVDRRFYRSRYDAARTLDAFSMQLRDQVDLDSVRSDLVDAVERTVRPAHASLWLRGTGR